MKLKVMLLFALLLLLLVGNFVYSTVIPKYIYSIEKIDENNLSVGYDFKNEEGVFYGRQVKSSFSMFSSDDFIKSVVLGDSSSRVSDKKSIGVDLTNQKLYAYEGTTLVYSFPISTGLWGTTPTGNFKIWTSIKSTTMSGGSKELGTYYYLPNVPYTMYFYSENIPKSRGYALHGAYWHDNFGNPMSHGCVNLSPENSEKLFYWVNPNFPENKYMVNNSADYFSPQITIYGKARPY